MSRQLLKKLAGSSTGKFTQLIDAFKGEPRIAWYPSVGEDLRDLLFLHPNFSIRNPADQPEPQGPELFIHSDYFPHDETPFLDSKVVYSDARTKMTVSTIEELPRINLPLDSEIVNFPNGSHATGHVVFLQINVESAVLGNYSYPLVYVFAENAAFCEKMVLPYLGKFSHIIHVRYGGGCGGGGKSSGSWLSEILPSLGCEVFITDGMHNEQSGDLRVFETYPLISKAKRKYALKRIRTIPEKSWSNHGDVTWNLVIHDTQGQG